ncbi:thiol-disulfide isomerase and thioredoxin [Actinobacillus indolicus]|nr:thiol-disulfide isomerase and thioredoxin [Actinobacillus indolicus]VTU09597.1 thiol-disulfide isomerase and thioredoxin [Actinobacillus indolicus]
MRIKQILQCFLGVIALYHSCFAQDSSIKEPLFRDGKGYYSYKQPLALELPADNKILITYFYQYGCSICLNADDALKQYAARNTDRVVLQRYPAMNKDDQLTLAFDSIFKALGRPELSDQYLFDSADTKDKLLKNNTEIKRWLTRNGISDEQFKYVLNSDSTKQIANQSKNINIQYSPIMAPMAILNGKYILVKDTLYNDDYTFAVLDFLVDKLQKEQENK